MDKDDREVDKLYSLKINVNMNKAEHLGHVNRTSEK